MLLTREPAGVFGFNSLTLSAISGEIPLLRLSAAGGDVVICASVSNFARSWSTSGVSGRGSELTLLGENEARVIEGGLVSGLAAIPARCVA